MIMSEAFVLESGRKHSVFGTVLKILCISLLVVLFLVAACYLLIAPSASYISIEVEGNVHIGIEELTSIAGIKPGEKWNDFEPARAEARLSAHPLFEKAEVAKKFPDRVVISVTERVPVAVAIGNYNGRSVPVEIDRNGLIFRIGATEETGSLPLITGLNMTSPEAGSSLNSQLQPLLHQLEILEKENPRLLSSISEIKIEPKTYGSYDLVLYPVHTPVPVRTDKALNEDALQYMMLVLDVVKDLDIDVKELDIRAGTVAYTLNDKSA